MRHLRTRQIGDFRGRKCHDKYKKAFERFMRDLKVVDEATRSAEG
jgi:hypothetical protein